LTKQTKGWRLPERGGILGPGERTTMGRCARSMAAPEEVA